MDTERLTAVMDSITNQTVLGELLAPVARALAKVRDTAAVSRVLSMADFVGLGVLRHLQGMRTVREQVQTLLHLEPGTALRLPLARSTWSDALSSPRRRAVLQAAMPPLLTEARALLPDRLAQFPTLKGRPVYAMDGTYQRESAHYGRCTPRQGGEDNPKGHALLSFYDVRLGCPTDVYVETRSRHETALLRDYDQSAQAMTRHKGALWLVDRAFIDAPFWDARKKRLGVTLITRMKKNLCIDSTEGLPVADVSVNEGVLKDLRITLRSSHQCWRLITFRSRRGHLVEFLTNDFDLEPGLIAFLYSRRWEEEKCFDTWKNDFSLAKAWGASVAAIENQVLLAIVTSLSLAMLLHRKMGQRGIEDKKALRKQDRRQTSKTDGTDRPDWTTPIFRYTSKMSRQVLRFFKCCFHKPASQALYEAQLRPMFLAYL
ncbi:transposase [Accumulibacter sp.]|uniref:transposase n=1 Tax=Accumulibacter sp. TaxID=2053492 RepID=UPI0028C4AC30|nr:transposase [Accumulibacter sp.]